MAENPPRRGKNPGGPLGYRIIGTWKLTTGLLLFAAWLGMFHLFKNDLTEELDWVVRHLRLDPESRIFHRVCDFVSGLDRKHLRAIEAGTFFSALLHVVEGIGLILERRWAGYLTIIATSSLIPFEVYEIVRKVSSIRMIVLVINLGFVIYLIVKLRQDNRDRDARRGGPDPGFASRRTNRETS
jgi:uncharacterized membrane protein (DUF2068 family)